MIVAITAGGRVDGELRDAIGTPVKALAPFANATLLDCGIVAARGAGATRVVVIGGTAVRRHCGAHVDAVIAESSDGAENITRALARGGSGDALLLLASDLPFVNPSDLASFVEAARMADVALPLATAEAYARSYPDAPPHITRIGNERIANGSVVYFGPGVAPRVITLARRLFDARKSLWRMVALLGPALLFRFASRTLRIEHIEARAQTLLGVNARAVRDAAPSLCYDVDSLADYRYAVAHSER